MRTSLLNNPTFKPRQRTEDDKGFTLIELLVVVVILGVLIAVAIPLYLNYRKGANDSATSSDLRNAISVLEVCQTDNNGAYPNGAATAPAFAIATPCANQKINLSAGTTLSYFNKGSGYVLSGINANGNANKYYCYDSTLGGSIKSQAAAGSATGC